MSLTDLHVLLGVTGRPSYVKAASEQVAEDAPVLPQACADGIKGTLPCNSKEATFLSAAKVASARAAGKPYNTETEQGIMKFARFWQITDDVVAAQKKIAAAAEPRTLGSSDFALNEVHQGTTLKKYAAYDGDTTTRAASAFYDNRHKYPLPWRQKTAKELIARATRFGVIGDIPGNVSTYLHKAAGYAFPSQEAITNSLVCRLNRLPGSKKVASEKLAAALGAIADAPHLRYNHALVQDVLTLTDRFDHELKLAAHYGDEDVTLPEEMLDLTTPMIKHAGEVHRGGEVDLQNGSTVNVHFLTKEALEVVDPELAKMSKLKLAGVLPTLPRPDADLLCKAAGVQKKTAGLMSSIAQRLNLTKSKDPVSPGASNIGKPPTNAELAKTAGPLETPGLPAGAGPAPMAPPQGQQPAPGPMDPAQAQQAASAPDAGHAPEFTQSPGQAATPTQHQGSPNSTGGGPLGGTGENAMDPNAVQLPNAGQGMFDSPLEDPGHADPSNGAGNILEDPSMEAASPSDTATSPAALHAGGAESGSAAPLGQSVGSPDPAAHAVIKDQTSGVPQGANAGPGTAAYGLGV
jgi:hypothetical protein